MFFSSNITNHKHAAQHESAGYPCSSEGQLHIGLYQQKHGQQVKRSDYFTLLGIYGTATGVLYSLGWKKNNSKSMSPALVLCSLMPPMHLPSPQLHEFICCDQTHAALLFSCSGDEVFARESWFQSSGTWTTILHHVQFYTKNLMGFFSLWILFL